MRKNEKGGFFQFAHRYRHNSAEKSKVYLSIINQLAETFNLILLGT
jgi:hypothetical protein